MTTLFVTILALPGAWSAVIAGLRRLHGDNRPEDITEKVWLAVCLAPVMIGIAVALWFWLAPVEMPMPALARVVSYLGSAVAETPIKAEPARSTHVHWVDLLCLAFAALYISGFALAAVPLIRAYVRVSRIVKFARRVEVAGEPVFVTGAAIPPLALGRSVILMPETIVKRFSVGDLQLILRHEAAHLHRRDPLWFTALAWIDVIFWFNPFVRGQTARCRAAAEIACDAAVLRGAPTMRESYARVLLRVLKHTAGDVRQYAPAAISPVKSGDYRMRLKEIMHARPRRRKPMVWLCAAMAAAAIPISAAQLAWSQTLSPAHLSPMSATAPERTTKAPALEDFSIQPVDGPVSENFGMRLHPKTGQAKFHQGIDFPVAIGTPVRAVAHGTVSYAGERGAYGTVVEIEHESGRMTRYAHLQSISIAAGQAVVAGQVIAQSGNSGQSDTPHLHFETWMDGKPHNPVNVYAGAASVIKMHDTLASGGVIILANKVSTDKANGLNTYEGDVEFKQGGRTVKADYVLWDVKTGKFDLRGHVVTVNADGTTTPGGTWSAPPHPEGITG